jgi:hypothetical protein
MYDIAFAYPTTLHRLTSITMFKTVSMELADDYQRVPQLCGVVVDPVSVQVRDLFQDEASVLITKFPNRHPVTRNHLSTKDISISSESPTKAIR